MSSVMTKLGVKSFADFADASAITYKKAYHHLGYNTAEHLLKHPNVQEFLRRSNKHYDLILVEQYYQEALLMLSHQFKAPIVSICM